MRLAAKLGLAAVLAAGVIGGAGAGAINVSNCPTVPGGGGAGSGAIVVVASNDAKGQAVKCTYVSGNGAPNAHSYRAQTPNTWQISWKMGRKNVVVAKGEGVTAGGPGATAKSGTFTAPKGSTVTILVNHGCSGSACGAIGFMTVGARN